MTNHRAIAAALAALAAGVGAAGGALANPAFTGHQLSGQARLSITQASAIALKARPGVIVDRELEKEAGGSGLRYSFDVKSRGKTFEVGVDAKTGRVLENGGESAGQEAQEAMADAKAKH